MMGDEKPTYEELETRLAAAEKTLKALRNEEIDAIIGHKGVYLLRLTELQKELAESKERVKEGEYTLSTLMEHVPEGITIADAPDVRICRVSDYGRQLLGKSSQELEGITVEQHVKEWNIYEQDGRTLAQKENLPLTRAVQKGEIVKNEEWVVGKADGSRIPIVCNAAPIRDGSGRITGGIIAWRDIGDIKKLEEKLREVNQELTEYSYALTHNLRAPLRAINNYVNFLLEDLADTLDGEPKKYLEGLRDAINLSNNQFNDLEKLYNIKNHPGNFESFEMRELLDEIQTIFKNVAGQELNIAQNWPVFRGEKALFRLILLDLINNGLKFNHSYKKRVEVGWQTTMDNRIEIFVRDNGIGIKPQYQLQIFEVFRRLHPEKEFGGTGIGLAVVKKAVKKMGGTIQVESAPGKGSTFFVCLPAAVLESAPT